MFALANINVKKSFTISLHAKKHLYVQSFGTNLPRYSYSAVDQKLYVENDAKPIECLYNIQSKLRKHQISMLTKFDIDTCDAKYNNIPLSGYRATLSVDWPIQISTCGFAHSKRDAQRKVTDMILTSLMKISLIDKNGRILPEALRQFDLEHMTSFHDSLECYSKELNDTLDGSLEFKTKPVKKKITTMILSNKLNTPLSERLKKPSTVLMQKFHTSAMAPICTSTPNRSPVKEKKSDSDSTEPLIEKETNNNSLQSNNLMIETELSNLSIRDENEMLANVPNENTSMKSLSNDLDVKNKTTVQNDDVREVVKKNLAEMLRHLKSEPNAQNEVDGVFDHPPKRSRVTIPLEPSLEDQSLELGGSTRKRKLKVKVQAQQNIETENAAENQETPTAYNVLVEKEERINYEKLEKQFPDPKNKLHVIYMVVKNEFKDKDYTEMFNYTQSTTARGTMQWHCTLKVLWPSEMNFTSTAKTKSASSKIVTLKCLHWLQANGKLKNGYPVIYDTNEVNTMLKKPVEINVDPEIMSEVKVLLNWYDREIEDLLDKKKTEANENVNQTIDLTDSSEDIIEEDDAQPVGTMELLVGEPVDPIRGRPLTTYSDSTLRKQSEVLYNKLMRRQLNSTPNKLPIEKYREDILKSLEQNRVLLVKGEPGCGKSTQVPQFILDYFSELRRGSECNIVVTQPRRISAISLAERVAQERGEEIGDVIGYQVRLKNVLPRGVSGGVLFCSTGILLRRLQNNPTLKGCSHVILDEAHERDINTDVLIVLLNRALHQNPNLKLVVMSATINASLFQKYFDCDAIHVPGFTHPVKMHYLEDIMKLGITKVPVQNMALPNPIVDPEAIAILVEWISRNKPEGAILCFLPGWAEIKKLRYILESRLSTRSHLIVPVHSRLPHYEQKRIFSHPPRGVRKIILATNIAETSITVDDVVYVIDSAAHKEQRWQMDKGISAIDNQWVSQANVNQRKGRAGRVRPGESYHFVTREKYDSLEQFPQPEVLRVQLEKTVLDCKIYSDEKAETFLAQMPEPPSTRAVQKAVAELLELGALDQDENLTALGKRIALFTTHPKLSKAMVYSTVFDCVCPIVTLTSVLSSESEIFSDGLLDKSSIRDLKKRFQPASDHIAFAWIYQQWESYNNKNWRSAEQFCRKSHLQPDKMNLLQKLRDLYAQHLTQCHMLDVSEDYNNLNSQINAYAGNDELVRGVLLAGLDQLLQRRDWDFKNGRLKRNTNVMLTEDGHRATITPESVNHKRFKWPSPYLTYLHQTHSMERRTTLIRETSLVSPLTVLLFCQGRVEGYKYQDEDGEDSKVLLSIKGKRNVKLLCDKELATDLLQFRDSMWAVTRYLVENQGWVYDDDTMEVVKSYKKRMLSTLSKMLHKAGSEIDYPDQVPRG